MTTVNMEALRHKDVRGKELLYLKIEKNGTQVLMNIGEKSYNALIALKEVEEVREEIKIKEVKNGK